MQKPYVNHVLHIILTILTGGLWLFVYIPILISYSGKMKEWNATHFR